MLVRLLPPETENSLFRAAWNIPARKSVRAGWFRCCSQACHLVWSIVTSKKKERIMNLSDVNLQTNSMLSQKCHSGAQIVSVDIFLHHPNLKQWLIAHQLITYLFQLAELMWFQSWCGSRPCATNVDEFTAVCLIVALMLLLHVDTILFLSGGCPRRRWRSTGWSQK